MQQSLVATLALLQGALVAGAPIVVDPPGPVGPIVGPGPVVHGPIVHPDGTVVARDTVSVNADGASVDGSISARQAVSVGADTPVGSDSGSINGRDVEIDAGASIPVKRQDVTVDANGNTVSGSISARQAVSVDANGNTVDASGNILPRQSVSVDADGNAVDASGNILPRHVITPGEHVHVPGPHNDIWVPPTHDKREVIQGPVVEPGKPGPDVVQGPVVSPGVPAPTVTLAPREVIQGPVIEPGKPGPDVVQGPVISPAPAASVTVAPRAVVSHAVWEHVPGPDNNILISAPVVEPGVPQHDVTPVPQA